MCKSSKRTALFSWRINQFRWKIRGKLKGHTHKAAPFGAAAVCNQVSCSQFPEPSASYESNPQAIVYNPRQFWWDLPNKKQAGLLENFSPKGRSVDRFWSPYSDKFPTRATAAMGNDSFTINQQWTNFLFLTLLSFPFPSSASWVTLQCFCQHQAGTSA